MFTADNGPPFNDTSNDAPLTPLLQREVPGIYNTLRRRIVTTDAYREGWIPQKPFMTGFWEMLPEGKGTRYRAGAWHWDEAAMQQHDQMGFVPGWSAVADQLAALAEAEAKGG